MIRHSGDVKRGAHEQRTKLRTQLEEFLEGVPPNVEVGVCNMSHPEYEGIFHLEVRPEIGETQLYVMVAKRVENVQILRMYIERGNITVGHVNVLKYKGRDEFVFYV